jgi:hypoxanthine phosphoribosyltransferase
MRRKLLPDLIIRHTDAKKSQSMRRAGERLSHLNQLNTIHLNRTPIKSVQKDTRYARSPLRRDRTVLVVDDFCTNGYSLEAARLNIMRTGAEVICVSWLKTINTDYLELIPSSNWDPYSPIKHDSLPGHIQRHSYGEAVAENRAASEVDEKFRAFCNWRW